MVTFHLFFSDLELMLLKYVYAQICAFQWCFKRVFYHFTILGFKNANNQIFEVNKGFECIFFRTEVQVISNPSSRLEKKHTKPLIFCL